MLDVNLLVSLAWPNHVHHQPALAWFQRRGNQPWATTPFTEAGFVRVSSNVSAIPAAVTPTEAMALLERMRAVFEHRFLVDDVPLVVGAYLRAERVASYRSVTDAHLLAVARRHEATLATFDRGIAALGGGQDVIVVPVSYQQVKGTGSGPPGAPPPARRLPYSLLGVSSNVDAT